MKTENQNKKSRMQPSPNSNQSLCMDLVPEVLAEDHLEKSLESLRYHLYPKTGNESKFFRTEAAEWEKPAKLPKDSKCVFLVFSLFSLRNQERTQSKIVESRIEQHVNCVSRRTDYRITMQIERSIQQDVSPGQPSKML